MLKVSQNDTDHQTGRQTEWKLQTCSWTSWASIASRRRSQWSSLRGGESSRNTLVLSLRSVIADKGVIKSGCKFSKRVRYTWCRYTAYKTSDQCKAAHLCPLHPSLLHHGLCQPSPVAEEKYADIQHTHPWLGSSHKERGVYVAQLSRRPGEFSLLASQTDFFSQRGP